MLFAAVLAVPAWAGIFSYAVAMLGRSLGGLVVAMVGERAAVPWWATDTGGALIVGGIIAAHLVATACLSRRLVRAEGSAGAAVRFGLLIAILIVAVPLAISVVIDHLDNGTASQQYSR